MTEAPTPGPARRPAWDPERVAWGRDETEACEAGTPGCCIAHRPADRNTNCQTW